MKGYKGYKGYMSYKSCIGGLAGVWIGGRVQGAAGLPEAKETPASFFHTIFCSCSLWPLGF